MYNNIQGFLSTLPKKSPQSRNLPKGIKVRAKAILSRQQKHLEMDSFNMKVAMISLWAGYPKSAVVGHGTKGYRVPEQSVRCIP